MKELLDNIFVLEAWEEHADPSGMLRAAHNQKNVLLVWWYSLVTGEFRKRKDFGASHSDEMEQEFLRQIQKEEGGLTPWVRGRVFKYAEKVYLIVYWPEKKGVISRTLLDLLDKVSNSIDVSVDRVIDDNGNDLSNMLESCKLYAVEKSVDGIFRVTEG